MIVRQPSCRRHGAVGIIFSARFSVPAVRKTALISLTFSVFKRLGRFTTILPNWACFGNTHIYIKHARVEIKSWWEINTFNYVSIVDYVMFRA